MIHLILGSSLPLIRRCTAAEGREEAGSNNAVFAITLPFVLPLSLHIAEARVVTKIDIVCWPVCHHEIAFTATKNTAVVNVVSLIAQPHFFNQSPVFTHALNMLHFSFISVLS
jgi:hypothetical protein